MCKFFVFSALSFCFSRTVWASGFVNKSNFSAEYVRSLSRNAATDSVDAVIYNPAGLTKLEDGLQIGIANQFVFKDYSHTVGTTEYGADNPTLFLPSFMLSMKKGDWTIFSSFFVPAGGGTLNYEDGNIIGLALAAALSDHALAGTKLDFTSKYYAFTFGFSHKINEKVSLSAGLKVVKGTSNYIATLNDAEVLNYEASAGSAAPFFNVDFYPNQDWTIALKYDSGVTLRWNVDNNTQDMGAIPVPLITDSKGTAMATGDRYYKDLPGSLSFGVAYAGIKDWNFSTSINVYLNSLSDFDGITEFQDSIGDSTEMSVAAEYQVIEPLKVSLGVLYSYTAIADAFYNKPPIDAIFNPYLNHWLLGTGAEYKICKNTKVNLGVMTAIYEKEDYKYANTTPLVLNKKTTVVALGLQSKI